MPTTPRRPARKSVTTQRPRAELTRDDLENLRMARHAHMRRLYL